MKYRAFVSYSHADEQWARWLHRSLERYRVPKHIVDSKGLSSARLTPVFLDRDELGTSTSLSASIRQALVDSEALIVICSPTAARSKWVNREVEEFAQLHCGENIFCCVVGGEAPAVFPPALLLSGEPLAADMRATADGRRAGFTKLVAGLLGVGFDDLRRREDQARQRKLLATAIASVAGMALMAVLSIWALVSSGEAEQARARADQRREQAENLLAFMVGDLRESLQPLGRLDLLDRVGDQAMKYFESIDADAINDSSLTLQSRVLTQIGEIRMWQFQYEAAVEAFQQAHRHAEPLTLRHPDNGEMLFRKSQAEFWVGNMRWRNGDLDGAQTWLQRYLDSSLRLSAIDPSRDDWLMEVAYGHHNLGVLAIEQRGLSRARQLFNRELAMLRELHSRSQTAADIRENLADAYSWLGTIAEREGELREALANYDESTRYRGELLADAPDDSGRKLWFAVASAFSASTRAITGQLEEAESNYAELITLLTDMLEDDPQNRQLLRYLARVQVDSAELVISAATEVGVAEALTLVSHATAALTTLLHDESGDRRTRITLAKAYRVAANLHLLGDHAETAAESASRAIDLVADDQSDVQLVREFGAALVLSTIALREAGRSYDADALAEYRSTFQLVAEQSRDPRTLDALARIAVLEGDTDRSAEIVGRLDQLGYLPIWPWFPNGP